MASRDQACSACASTLDCFGDHAEVCPAKGDLTLRHNGVQRILWEECKRAGLEAELEKGGLLPDKPAEERPDGAEEAQQDSRESQEGGDGRRRPADIWLPKGAKGRGDCKAVAHDVGFSSGLQHEVARWSATDPDYAVRGYRARKEAFKETLKKCLDQGFDFSPLIFESHGGGFGPEVRALISKVADLQEAKGVFCKEGHSLRIAQRVSTALHKASARAILRRTAVDCGWDEAPASELVGSWELQ